MSQITPQLINVGRPLNGVSSGSIVQLIGGNTNLNHSVGVGPHGGTQSGSGRSVLDALAASPSVIRGTPSAPQSMRTSASALPTTPIGAVTIDDTVFNKLEAVLSRIIERLERSIESLLAKLIGASSGAPGSPTDPLSSPLGTASQGASTVATGGGASAVTTSSGSGVPADVQSEAGTFPWLQSGAVSPGGFPPGGFLVLPLNGSNIGAALGDSSEAHNGLGTGSTAAGGATMNGSCGLPAMNVTLIQPNLGGIGSVTGAANMPTPAADSDLLSSVLGALGGLASPVLGTVKDLAGGLLGGLFKKGWSLFGSIFNGGASLLGSIVRGGASLAGSVAEKGGSLISGAKDLLKGLF